MVKAQSNLGVGTPTPDASAKLDVSSTTQGMLVPRMTKAQRDVINSVAGVSTPATGLMIYQTDNTPGFYFYNGTAWTSLSGGGTVGGAQLVFEAQQLTGGQTINVGTNATDGTGTIAFKDVIVRTVGTYAFDSVYTVGQSGFYNITAHVVATAPSNGSQNGPNLAPYIEIKDPALAKVRRYYGTSISSSGISPSLGGAARSRGEVTAWVNLEAGDTVRIRVNNLSQSFNGPISTSGSTRWTIVKF